MSFSVSFSVVFLDGVLERLLGHFSQKWVPFGCLLGDFSSLFR